MASSGSGTGTPISTSAAASATIQFDYTLLALDRFARIMGLNPAHFNQAAGATVFPAGGGCNTVFFQHPWQNHDQISRTEIVSAIKAAEDEIARQLGYYPGPVWIENEVHEYPQYHRRERVTTNIVNTRGLVKGITANWGRLIQAGRRATSAIKEAASVTYSDPDGDGYNELATITATTTVTDKCEIKLYFAGFGGDRRYEIRPLKSNTLSGGTVTITVDAWQLLDPDLKEALPTTAGATAINLENINNYVATVDVYREYTDFSQASATFYWEPEPKNTLGVSGLCNSCGSSSCPACSLTTQNGCLFVRDVDLGIVVPQPATYDSTDEEWDKADLTACRDPDQVKIWYYAGDIDQEYLGGRTCDPLSNYWAETITWLTVARLDRPVCSCGTVKAFAEGLQEDLSLQGERSFFLDESILGNPFGTRRGEVMAWRRVGALADSVAGGVV